MHGKQKKMTEEFEKLIKILTSIKEMKNKMIEVEEAEKLNEMKVKKKVSKLNPIKQPQTKIFLNIGMALKLNKQLDNNLSSAQNNFSPTTPLPLINTY